MAEYHEPVLVEEVLHYLAPAPGGVIVDGTLGGSGHAERIAESLGKAGRLIGLDRDADAISAAEKRLFALPGERPEVTLIQSDFRELPAALSGLGLRPGGELSGLLLDLGVSSHQLDQAERGFSFRQDAPLDMRMDRRGGPTAADLVRDLPEAEIARLLFEYGEERFARRIAARIAERRQRRSMETTRQLAELVEGAIPRKTWPAGIHPATRTFQALRIAVNDELAALAAALGAAARWLAPGGRLVVIAYHSLEDRIVKRRLAELAGRAEESRSPLPGPARPELLTVLTRKPVTPGPDEVAANPRARSAKLRAAERTETSWPAHGDEDADDGGNRRTSSR